MNGCLSSVVVCLQSYDFGAVESIVVALASVSVTVAVVYGAAAVIIHVIKRMGGHRG